MQQGISIPTVIANDANAGALAQLWNHEKNLTKKDLIYIVAGQGIGCGMISDGAILQGAIGIAGEIGHTTIDYHGPRCACRKDAGCLELYASVLALKERIRTHFFPERNPAYPLEELNGASGNTAIRNAWEEGDALTISEEFHRTCKYLAIGLVSLINQMDPELVILGDSLAEIGGERMLEIIRNEIKARIRPIIWKNLRVELSTLPENPILIGAGAVAIEHIFENPLLFV